MLVLVAGLSVDGRLNFLAFEHPDSCFGDVVMWCV